MVIPFSRRIFGGVPFFCACAVEAKFEAIPERANPPSIFLLEKAGNSIMDRSNKFPCSLAMSNSIDFDACPSGGGIGILPQMNPEQALLDKNITLPPTPVAAGMYKPMMISGNLAYLSGHLPILADGTMLVGQVSVDCTIEEGSAAARQVGLNMLATLRAGLGSLDRISRVIKLLGLVNAPAGFTQHPLVVNGCSELLKEIFGDDMGVGARSAFGVSGLPAGAIVEVEGIFELKE